MIKKIIKKLEKGIGLDIDKISLTAEEASDLLKFLREQEKEKEEMREKIDNSIDLNYAMAQVEMGKREAKTDLERQVFEGFQGFLYALPSYKDIEAHVYCADCEHFSATEDGPVCPYSDMCHLWNCEDSAPHSERPCYTPKEE